MPADVTLTHVTKRFEETLAVDDLSLEIERGSFFALLGPSGCGKTTTLRMIGGFEEPTDGSIYLGEREVSGLPSYKRDVNTVFQSYALFPHLSIFENVAFGMRRRGIKGSELKSSVLEALELVGLTGLENRRPRQLSGGQQQRIALARALVNRPEKIRVAAGETNTLSGTVAESAYIGVSTQYIVDTPAGSVTVYVQNERTGTAGLSVGERLTLSWSPESTFVVDSPEVVHVSS